MNKIAILLLIIIIAATIVLLYRYFNDNQMNNAYIEPTLTRLYNNPVTTDMQQPAVIPSEQLVNPSNSGSFENPQVGHLIPETVSVTRNSTDQYMINPLINSPYLDIPLRNMPDTYKHIGYLVDEECKDYGDLNRTLKLFGRPKFPGSNNVDYYVLIHVEDQEFRIDLDQIRKEIYQYDSIYVSILQRNYKARMLDVFNFFNY